MLSSRVFSAFLIAALNVTQSAAAATINAGGCSQTAVQNAINSASPGDTVQFSGNCTWTAYHRGLSDEQPYAILLNKPVTLEGLNSPVITHGDHRKAGAPDITLISIQPSAEHIDGLIRVTGIYFENTVFCPSCGANLYTPDIAVAGSRNFRIDHNVFHYGKSILRTWGWANGVIDNNTFDNNDGGIFPSDDPDARNSRPDTNAWGRPMRPGSADFVFIENNTFILSNVANCRALNEFIYHANGGRAVTRYNTFNVACTEAGDTIIDAHGLAGCDRGTVLAEIYNNQFTFARDDYLIGKLRGGSFLIHDNVITTPSRPSAVRLSNEQCWNQPYYTGDTVWPSRDQINNTYIWGNRTNGSQSIPVVHYIANSMCTSNGYAGADRFTCCTGPQTGVCEDYFIQPGREYFMAKPAASGQGYTQWNGIRPTDAGPKGGETNVTFVAGASAYYPYTPYICPHPATGLTGSCNPEMAGKAGYNVAGSVRPEPPSNFSVLPKAN